MHLHFLSFHTVYRNIYESSQAFRNEILVQFLEITDFMEFCKVTHFLQKAASFTQYCCQALFNNVETRTENSSPKS